MSETQQRRPEEPSIVGRLNVALNEAIDRNEQLETENARLQGRLDALTSAFSADGAIGVLRSICHDATLPHELRLKAAAALAPYETPKLSLQAKTNVRSLFDTLETLRLRDLEQKAAAAKVIEHAPAEPATTVLGSDDPAA
jgi:hypothetical protein